jgi:gliding motility-associated-like protein
MNLVIDPSFENNDSCNNLLFIKGTKTWHSLDSTNNVAPFVIYTPVYMNLCDTNTGMLGSLPVEYHCGTSIMYPRTGNGLYYINYHVDFSANPGYNRDYLRGHIKHLISNKQYCGKFYISLFKTMRYGIDRFGAVLDNGALDVNPCMLPIIATPTWENPAFNYITDTIGWQKIQGVFTANGNETYITIGNFYSDANTHKTIFNSISSACPEAAYYTDDVSIIATDITAYAGNDATICVTDSIHLGRPQEVGLECLWYKSTIATPFATTSDVWFKPTQTGTYTFIQRMDNCAITWDTVNITVIQDCSLLLTTKEIPNVFTPNGDGVNDVFSFTFSGALTNFSLYNRWGNIIQTTNNQSHTTILWDGRTTSGEACSEGVYFYSLEYKDSKGDVIKKNGYVSLIR